MNDQTDAQLLRAYAEHRSDPAFAELVRRHVDIVYSAALRMVCDAHLAQDVTQGAFVALARNAAQLTDRPVLSGWLHRTAQNIAAQTVRTEVRRRVREQEAATMNQLLSIEPDASWERIAPHLDAALGELSETDRDALLLRYFERRSASEMAQRLGISDEAAQKRVNRAVERLREFFAKRGLPVGASGLVVVIAANAVQAAPVGLALTISTAALLTGTTLATTATATVTKAIAMTALQKTIFAATVAILAGAGIYETRQTSQLREQNQTLQQQQSPLAEQIQQLQSERDDYARQFAALRDDNARLNRNTLELLKLRGEVGMLRKQTTLMPNQEDKAAFEKRKNDIIHVAKSLALCIKVYAADNQGRYATNFDQMAELLSSNWGTNSTGKLNLPGNLDRSDFEFINAGLVNETTPDAIMLRERVPRKSPDGDWERLNVFVDGRVQEATSKDGRFDENENPYLVDPRQGFPEAQLPEQTTETVNLNQFVNGLDDNGAIGPQLAAQLQKQIQAQEELNQLIKQGKVPADVVTKLFSSPNLEGITDPAYAPIIAAIKKLRDQSHIKIITKRMMGLEQSHATDSSSK